MLLAEEVVEAKFTFPERLGGIDGWLQMMQDLFTLYPLLGVLLLLIVLDIVTGTIAGAINGRLASVISYQGLLKKGIVVLAVVTAKVLEFVIPQAPLMALGCLGFIAYELKSIVENCGKAGMPLPPRLKRAFEQFQESEELKAKSPTVVTVNVDTPSESKFKRPSDVVMNVHESGVLEVQDTAARSTVVVHPKGAKGDTGDTGAKGDKGEKGDTGAKGGS